MEYQNMIRFDEYRPMIDDVMIQSLIQIARGESLSTDQSDHVFEKMAQGACTPAQIGALLMGLHQKGEHIDEITGAVRALRRHAVTAPLHPNDLAVGDVCGTGGDGQHSLNVSTAVALTLAGCDVAIAKHGNRAASSKCGTADVLEFLGVKIDCSPETSMKSLMNHHICFLMAPAWHPTLKPLASIRKELKFRTIFNLLGPLLNPLSLTWQMIGVFAPEWLDNIAETATRTGVQKCWAVHGHDGLDELTITGPSQIIEITNGTRKHWTITPEDAGLPRSDLDGLRGGDAAFNARALLGLLRGETGPYRDIVLLNSAAALIVAGRVNTMTEGVQCAAHAIDRGHALNRLNQLVATTQQG